MATLCGSDIICTKVGRAIVKQSIVSQKAYLKPLFFQDIVDNPKYTENVI